MGFLIALGFLTSIPIPLRRVWEPRELASSRAYFPLVGLLIGGLLAGLDWLLHLFLPVALSSVLLLVAWVLLTGGLHLDGLMDTCDGVFGGTELQQRREIMADPRVGGYGIVGAILILLIKVSALISLPVSGRIASLVLVPAISRWTMVLAIALFPYAKAQGLGAAFQGEGRFVAAVVAGVISLVASYLLLRVTGIGLLLVCSLAAWALGRWLCSLLGGLTGDTYGAVNEVVEALAMVILVAVLPLGVI